MVECLGMWHSRVLNVRSILTSLTPKGLSPVKKKKKQLKENKAFYHRLTIKWEVIGGKRTKDKNRREVPLVT